MCDKAQKGFTLPELLVTGLIFGLFAVGATILVHPVEYKSAQRNAERWTGVAQLMQAFAKYKTEHGALPKTLPSDVALIGSDIGMFDLCGELTPKYLKELPIDPAAQVESAGTCQSGGVVITGFAVQAVDNTVVVSAPLAEAGEEVILSRKF